MNLGHPDELGNVKQHVARPDGHRSLRKMGRHLANIENKKNNWSFLYIGALLWSIPSSQDFLLLILGKMWADNQKNYMISYHDILLRNVGQTEILDCLSVSVSKISSRRMWHDWVGLLRLPKGVLKSGVFNLFHLWTTKSFTNWYVKSTDLSNSQLFSHIVRASTYGLIPQCTGHNNISEPNMKVQVSLTKTKSP